MEILITAIIHPVICLAKLAATFQDESIYFNRNSRVTFSDEDLQLQMIYHNHPLHISVNARNFILSRVFIDLGASSDNMNIKCLTCLKVNTHKLAINKLVLCRFNEKGEKDLGSFMLLLRVGELKKETKFQKYNLATSFNVLLGRFWIYEYRMVPSTLHQCIK